MNTSNNPEVDTQRPNQANLNWPTNPQENEPVKDDLAGVNFEGGPWDNSSRAAHELEMTNGMNENSDNSAQEASANSENTTGNMQGFNSINELMSYTKLLEEKLKNFQPQNNQEQTLGSLVNTLTPNSNNHTPVTKQIGDMFFEDPNKALSMHEDMILKKIDEKLEAKKQADQFWVDFGRENPDIKDLEVIGREYIDLNWVHIKQLPLSEVKKKVASHVRDRQKLFLDRGRVGTKLSSGSPVALGNTGTAGRSLPKAEPMAATFIDQLKKVQSRGK